MTWKLYDQLIEQIPPHIKIDWVHMGSTWTIVHAGPFCGVAATVNEQDLTLPSYSVLSGTDLQSVASLCKSWNFLDASVGTAALNAYYNSTRIAYSFPGTRCTENAFTDYSLAVENKKAAIIGHFFNLEKFLTKAESVSVLERRPCPGDYPDSACEYLLPEQDFVFITGSAFINKTLPRLLELSSGCRSIILGPSTPMSPILFDYGADELSGLLPNCLNPEQAVLAGAGNQKMSSFGTRVRLRKEDL